MTLNDKLLKKCQKLYDCQKNLYSKILSLSVFLLNDCIIPLEPYQSTIILLARESLCGDINRTFNYIFILEREQDRHLFEFEDFMKRPIAKTFFSESEIERINQILSNIRVAVKSENGNVMKAIKEFIENLLFLGLKKAIKLDLTRMLIE